MSPVLYHDTNDFIALCRQLCASLTLLLLSLLILPPTLKEDVRLLVIHSFILNLTNTA